MPSRTASPVEVKCWREAGLAQTVEQLICNQKVAGSIPAPGTKNPSDGVLRSPNCFDKPAE